MKFLFDMSQDHAEALDGQALRRGSCILRHRASHKSRTPALKTPDTLPLKSTGKQCNDNLRSFGLFIQL
jgi:hypothetical protein